MNKGPLPKVPIQHKSDRAGQTILSAACDELDWVNHPTPGSDYGFDGTIMHVQSSEVTGLQFGYQLKTMEEALPAKDGFLHVSGIKTSTLNMWKNGNLIPVIFVADRKTKTIFWDFIDAAIRRLEDARSKTKTGAPSATATLTVHPNRFSRSGVSELVRLLTEQSAAMPRPIQVAATATYQLDRLTFEGDQKAEIEDVVTFANAGRYQRAVDKAQALLKSTTVKEERVKLFRVLTKSMFEMERESQAIEYALEGLKLDGKNLVLLNSLSLAYLYDDQTEQAFKAIRRARKINPSDANVANTEGVLLIRLCRYKQAQKAISAALKLDPRNKEIRSNQAFLLRHVGNVKDSLTAFRELWKDDRTNHYAGLAVASLLFEEHGRTGKPELLTEVSSLCDEVATYFEKNPPKDLQARSSETTLLSTQAAVASATGDAKKALEILAKINPSRGAQASAIFYNRGQMHLLLGDFAGARRDNVLSLRGHKESPQFSSILDKKLISLGTAHLNLFGLNKGKPRAQKYINKAIRYYRAALKLAASEPIFIDLACAFIATGRPDEALRLADAHKKYPGAHFVRAMIHKDRGENALWLEELNKQWKHEPDGFQVNLHLGHYWYDQSNWEKAKEHLLRSYSHPRPFSWAASPMMAALLLICLHNTKDGAREKALIASIPDFLLKNSNVTSAIEAAARAAGRNALVDLNTNYMNRLARKLE